jgi:carboxylesterase type B
MAPVSVRVFEPELEQTDSLPVMIYIHGGGFTLGTGKDYAMDYVATYVRAFAATTPSLPPSFLH